MRPSNKTPKLQQPETIPMKTAVLALLFFFTISTTLPSATADDLVDTDGNLLLNGGSYYFLSETGQGLELAQLGNDSKPVSVIQSAIVSNGYPLSPSSPLRIAILKTAFYLNINFVGIADSYWENVGDLVKVNELRQVFGAFKLETYKKGLYQILYYDSDNETYTPLRVSSSSDRYLNLIEGDLLIVKFKKAVESPSWMSIV